MADTDGNHAEGPDEQRGDGGAPVDDKSDLTKGQKLAVEFILQLNGDVLCKFEWPSGTNMPPENIAQASASLISYIRTDAAVDLMQDAVSHTGNLKGRNEDRQIAASISSIINQQALTEEAKRKQKKRLVVPPRKAFAKGSMNNND